MSTKQNRTRLLNSINSLKTKKTMETKQKRYEIDYNVNGSKMWHLISADSEESALKEFEAKARRFYSKDRLPSNFISEFTVSVESIKEF